MSEPGPAKRLITAARDLANEVDLLKFAPPVAHVYNPLRYAWRSHEEYLRRFGNSRKRVLFLGMNPGPFGMVQTGIPFGEVRAVRDWMEIRAAPEPPPNQHPKRPILGLACARSEVSGQRLWKLFADRFGTAEKFFAEHFVVNYCPLAFVEASGANRTPNKLPAHEIADVYRLCDDHLHQVLDALAPEWLIGIGAFAARRASLVCDSGMTKVGQILHPSPASPAANRNWAGLATRELIRLGVWC